MYIDVDTLGSGASVRAGAASFRVVIERDFATEEQCETVINTIDERVMPACVAGAAPRHPNRTSWATRFEEGVPPELAALDDAICSYVGIGPAYGERIEGQRYRAGEFFAPHYDCFDRTAGYWPTQEQLGGQRTLTAMIWLNDRIEGGATVFPLAGLRIQPRRGSLLVWNNLDANGEISRDSLHAGEIVSAGRKYVLTKWFREKPIVRRL